MTQFNRFFDERSREQARSRCNPALGIKEYAFQIKKALKVSALLRFCYLGATAGGNASPEDEPRRQSDCCSNQNPMKMMAEEDSHGVNNLRAKLQYENSQHKKAHSSTEENREQEMTNAHLADGGGERKQLEGGGWGQHCGEHQAPERMLLERCMHFFKSLRGYPLPQQFLAAFVANGVNDQAA